jgi:hypothetical protein
MAWGFFLISGSCLIARRRATLGLPAVSAALIYTHVRCVPRARVRLINTMHVRECVFIRAMDSACEGSLRRRGPLPVADAEAGEVLDTFLVAVTDSCGRNPRAVYWRSFAVPRLTLLRAAALVSNRDPSIATLCPPVLYQCNISTHGLSDGEKPSSHAGPSKPRQSRVSPRRCAQGRIKRQIGRCCDVNSQKVPRRGAPGLGVARQ